MLKIGVYGSTGKMGTELTKVIANNSDLYSLVGTYSSKDKNDRGKLLSLCQRSDVVVDFSLPEALSVLLESALKNSTCLVIGTTGILEGQKGSIKDASKEIPIFYSENMSFVVNLMSLLVKKAAELLDYNYDVEILEMHHKNKRDAPSGTAIMLGCAVAEGRKSQFNTIAYFDKVTKGLRTKGEINFVSIRAGSVIGNHEVMFVGQDEILSMKHQAMNRSLFAKGALIAANWLVSKKNLVYILILIYYWIFILISLRIYKFEDSI